MEVFKIHSKVNVAHLSGCEVLAINLRDNYLQYLVGYWNNNEFKEAWFDSHMVKGYNSDKMTIGFKG